MHLYLIGNGGHAISLFAILTALKFSIDGIINKLSSEEVNISSGIKGLPLINENDFLSNKNQDRSLLINGVGSVKDMTNRCAVFDKFKKLKYRFKTIIAPSAIVRGDVIFGEGVQVMTGAMILTDCIIDDNSIINTGAIIDHTCHVGSHVHVAPGVVISGNVNIGDRSHIGSGAVIIQGINIGCNALIGAGAVVINDIPDNAKALGVPAKVIER